MPPARRQRPALVTLVLLVLCCLPASSAPAGAGARSCSPAWTRSPTPNVDPLNSPLTAVDARTATDVWAVGYRSAAAQSMHWDGTAWTAHPMPVPPGTAQMGAFDVAAVRAERAWAVGWRYASGPHEGGRAFVQRWNGVAWRSVAIADLAGTYGELLAVDVAAPDDIWAVGLTRGSAPGGAPQPLAVHFDGDAWRRVPTPTIPGPSASFADVHVVAPDDVWAVGTRQPPASQGIGDRTLIEHWNGTEWTVVPSPETDEQVHYLSAVDGSGPDDVWAVGAVGGFRLLAQHWDGTSWTIQDTGLDSPDAPDPGFSDVEAVSDHDVWVLLARRSGRSEAAHFDGETWSAAPGPPAAGRYSVDLGVTPEGDVWAVGATRGRGRNASLAEELCPSRPSSSGFDPDAVTTRYGTAVAWTIPPGDTRVRRLLDATGLSRFDSGDLTATDTFTYRFAVAGIYRVLESHTGTEQVVRVRPSAHERPRLGAGTIRVSWAVEIPADLVVDVQVRRPGASTWRSFRVGTSETSAFFTADAGGGNYAFRSRLRDPASGATSGWSPKVMVAIAP